MKLVNHLLEAKGSEVVSIVPQATVFEAIRLMADKAIGSLLVMESGELRGIITERDYARKVILKGRSSENTIVAEIMTQDVLTTTKSETVTNCMQVMTTRRVRHLPVVDGAQVVGLISIGDLVQAIISDQQEEIQQLGQYISG
ncbi:MAG: CBS domain-containing protein [Woeseiaceae bacterium]